MIDSHCYDITSQDAVDRNRLAGLIPRHLEWLEVKNYSKNTVSARRKNLRRFLEWCHDRGILWPSEVTKPILERYQRHLFYHCKSNGKPIAFSTQVVHIVALKALFKWLSRNNYVLYNPAADLERPKTTRRLPRYVLTVEETEKILNQADTSDPFGVRDRAIMETLYSTGIRRSELINLSVYDLNSEAGTLMIRCGKGNKDRVVPIGVRALMWVDKYLMDVRHDLMVDKNVESLFLTRLGDGMSADNLTWLVRKYVVAAGVEKPGACHLFRHTMATLMLENGADIRYIQHILGHASLDTTQIYTHVSILKLKEIHKATHPAGRVREHLNSEA